MDIGGKLQRARKQANITQEKAAEALGVSRQTLSNWENEKTYPDIISVIKMSDLYSVSLDHLLKEEKPVSNYLDYLEESTDVVKKKNKLSKLILICSYLVIWAAALLVFWLFADGSDAMAYSLIVFWFVLPVATVTVCALIGANGWWGKGKWFSPLILGVMYMLAEYATFSAANTVSFDKLNAPDFMMIIYGAAFSVVGLAIGMLIKHFRARKNRN
ncbi:MAG: helix-turn-helix domain-containing protein [Acutalibacteraceae bacterium]